MNPLTPLATSFLLLVFGTYKCVKRAIWHINRDFPISSEEVTTWKDWFKSVVLETDMLKERVAT